MTTPTDTAAVLHSLSALRDEITEMEKTLFLKKKTYQEQLDTLSRAVDQFRGLVAPPAARFRQGAAGVASPKGRKRSGSRNASLRPAILAYLAKRAGPTPLAEIVASVGEDTRKVMIALQNAKVAKEIESVSRGIYRVTTVGLGKSGGSAASRGPGYRKRAAAK